MSTCSCGAEYDDEHGHGICFGCKIRGIQFGTVPQGASRMAREKLETQQILAKGYEPIRREELSDKRDDPPKKFKLPEHISREIHERTRAIS